MTKITINTLTTAYDDREDRIRLSINYQQLQNRIDLMVTRSFILDLVPSLEEYIQTYYTDIVESAQNTQTQAEPTASDPRKAHKLHKESTVSKTNMEDLALYKSKEELLITVKLSYNKETKYTYIRFLTQKTEVVLNCDVQILKNIVHAIKKTIPSIQWGISKFF